MFRRPFAIAIVIAAASWQVAAPVLAEQVIEEVVVTATKRDIIAALHHACAAAFANQALDGNGDPGALGRGLLRMQGRKKPGTA